MATCSVPSCPNPIRARQLCWGHYQRWYLTGDLAPDIPIRTKGKTREKEPFDERFWKKVDRSRGPDACWPWTDQINKKGYGHFAGWYYPGDERIIISAHRGAYILTYGPIPEGMEVDHTCHTQGCVLGTQCPHRQCCNPAHLEVVTKRINLKRGRSQIYKRQMTHCHRGHPFDAENTYNNGYNPNGTMKRACKRCRELRLNSPMQYKLI